MDVKFESSVLRECQNSVLMCDIGGRYSLLKQAYNIPCNLLFVELWWNVIEQHFSNVQGLLNCELCFCFLFLFFYLGPCFVLMLIFLLLLLHSICYFLLIISDMYAFSHSLFTWYYFYYLFCVYSGWFCLYWHPLLWYLCNYTININVFMYMIIHIIISCLSVQRPL